MEGERAWQATSKCCQKNDLLFILINFGVVFVKLGSEQMHGQAQHPHGAPRSATLAVLGFPVHFRPGKGLETWIVFSWLNFSSPSHLTRDARDSVSRPRVNQSWSVVPWQEVASPIFRRPQTRSYMRNLHRFELWWELPKSKANSHFFFQKGGQVHRTYMSRNQIIYPSGLVNWMQWTTSNLCLPPWPLMGLIMQLAVRKSSVKNESGGGGEATGSFPLTTLGCWGDKKCFSSWNLLTQREARILQRHWRHDSTKQLLSCWQLFCWLKLTGCLVTKALLLQINHIWIITFLAVCATHKLP